jgi:hypothetical protein
MILAVTEAERVSLIAEAVLINWVSPRGNWLASATWAVKLIVFVWVGVKSPILRPEIMFPETGRLSILKFPW